jgi:TonB family protein
LGDAVRSWTWIVVAAGLFPALAFAQDASHEKTVGRPHSCEHYFPDDLRYDGAQGETTLTFTVTVNGGVADIKVAKSSGNAELDAAAVACASHWRYKLADPSATPKPVPWGANVAWSVPRKDVADQIHRNFKPAAPDAATGGKQ